MLVAESQCAIAAEVTVGFGLANLAFGGKGSHKQDEVVYFIKNGCCHNRRCFDFRRQSYEFFFNYSPLSPLKIRKASEDAPICHLRTWYSSSLQGKADASLALLLLRSSFRPPIHGLIVT
jgi:hypothetical protein